MGKASSLFTLYRHAAFELRMPAADDSVRILFDPLLSDPQGTIIRGFQPFPNHPLPKAPEEIMAVDAVLITHAHEDHLDKTAVQLMPPKMPVFTSGDSAKKLNKQGFTAVKGLAPGETTMFAGVKITAAPTCAVPSKTGWFRKLGGDGIGFFLEAGGKRVYVSGDTVLHPKVLRSVREAGYIDLAVLFGGATQIPWFGLHTLTAAQIHKFIAQIGPRITTVIHLGEIQHNTEERSGVGTILAGRHGVRIPQNGESFEF